MLRPLWPLAVHLSPPRLVGIQRHFPLPFWRSPTLSSSSRGSFLLWFLPSLKLCHFPSRCATFSLVHKLGATVPCFFGNSVTCRLVSPLGLLGKFEGYCVSPPSVPRNPAFSPFPPVLPSLLPFAAPSRRPVTLSLWDSPRTGS